MVTEDSLKSLLDLEYREWMTKISATFRERDRQIEGLRRESYSRANPTAALQMWARPVRLAALRKAVLARLELRAEYAQRRPEIAGEEVLSALHNDLKRFVEHAAKGDPRSLPEVGDILAELRVSIDKLKLTFVADGPDQSAPKQAAEKVFISYSWDDQAHKAWVAEFATRLTDDDGIDVILDEWHLPLGARSPEFMEQGVRDSRFVLVVCTEGYKSRFDKRIGGAGYEGHIITGELISAAAVTKFIPVLRQGTWGSAIPTALTGVFGVDLRQNSSDEYRKLASHLKGSRKAPPIASSSIVAASSRTASTFFDSESSWGTTTDQLRLPVEDLALLCEKRGASLVIWLRNETLDPIDSCGATLEGLQRYSESRRDFYRNPAAPLSLIRPQRINAGETSKEAVALVRCPQIHKSILAVSDSMIQFGEGATWLGTILVEGGGKQRTEEIFFRWTPGDDPDFTEDPRT